VKFNGLSLGSIIGAVILLVIAFTAITATVPVLNDALGNLSAVSGLPFGSLFGRNGIIVLGLMGAVILGVVAYLGFSGSKK
jgi:hypothetical protein